MTDQELSALEALDPRAAQIEAIRIVFGCSLERAEQMWVRVNAISLEMDRIIRGGDRQNSDLDYLTMTFRTDLPSKERSMMGFRTFRPSRVPQFVGPFRA